MTIEITSWEELAGVNDNLSGDYVLMNDLNEDSVGYNTYASSTADSNKGWQPLGGTVSPNWDTFTGTFDGQGYTIKGLNVKTGDYYCAGLFGFVSGADTVIENIILKDVNIDSSANESVGGLIGSVSYTTGGGIIRNCHVTGTVKGDGIVGGFVGKGGYMAFSNCSVNVSVQGGTVVGGFIGQADYGSFENCFTKGSVLGTNDVGGFGGYNNRVNAYLNCYSEATVTRKNGVTGENFGGFIGRNSRSAIKKCYATGSVSYDGATNPTSKGFTGIITSTSSPYVEERLYFDKDTTGQTSTSGGASGKTTSEMQEAVTFVDWDIVDKSVHNEEVWYIEEDEDYPRLFWEAGGEEPVIPSRLKVRIGSEWQEANLKRYNGTDWEGATIKYREGEGWKGN